MTLERKELLSALSKKAWDESSPEFKAMTFETMRKGRIIRDELGSFKDAWAVKGADYAAARIKQFKEKCRARAIGSRNNMYGKPSPKGAGNGWKGYLDGRYCRSIREALFIAIELKEIAWESGEKEKYKISYVDPLGATRNYFPDFVTHEFIIECKPKRLWKTPLIEAKARAARKFAKALGKKYKLVDMEIQPIVIAELVETGRWKFDKRYEERYQKFLAKNENSDRVTI